MKRYWTTEELRMIRDNLKLSDRRIADLLGRSVVSVKRCRMRNGLVKANKSGRIRSLSDEQIEEIRSSPYSSHQLAFVYDVNHGTILNYKK
jgi:DNA-binding transcriptional regulator YiaG